MYMKLLLVFFLITLLTLTAARRHVPKLQFDNSFESDEYDSDQRPGNGHRRVRNHRGRGGHHQGVMRGKVGGPQDGYPIRGPVQQPFIPAPSDGRGQGPHRFAEPQNSFQQQRPTHNNQFPFNNMQQPSQQFPQHSGPTTQNYQGPPTQGNNFQQQPMNNYQGPPTQGNNFQQQPGNKFPVPMNNYQGPLTQGNNFQQQPANNNNFQQQPGNNFPVSMNNYQGPPTQGNNFQQQPGNNFPVPMNNYQGPPIQANPSSQNAALQQPSSNPFLPQRNNNNQQQPQQQTQTPAQTNKQNANTLQPATNELPTTIEPPNTTPYFMNPRKTDLLYGSNLLEEDQKTTTETAGFELIDRGLFDTAPHCQPDYILVNNKCRLKV